MRPLLAAASHFVPQRSQRVSQFLQPQFESRLYRSKRSVCRGGNFPVAQSLEESQLHGFALKLRQCPDGFLQEMMEIIQNLV